MSKKTTKSARHVSKMSKHNYCKELDRRIAELPADEELDASGPLKAVGASPQGLAKVLFEITPDEFGCL